MFGPGSMFVTAALIFMVASACACALPKDKANSARNNSGSNGYSPIDSEASIAQEQHDPEEDRSVLEQAV